MACLLLLPAQNAPLLRVPLNLTNRQQFCAAGGLWELRLARSHLRRLPPPFCAAEVRKHLVVKGRCCGLLWGDQAQTMHLLLLQRSWRHVAAGLSRQGSPSSPSEVQLISRSEPVWSLAPPSVWQRGQGDQTSPASSLTQQAGVGVPLSA